LASIWSTANLEMAKRFGATHCINSGKVDDLAAEIRKIVGKCGSGRGGGHHWQCARDRAGIRTHACRRQDHSVGVTEKGRQHFDLFAAAAFKKVLRGSHGAVPNRNRHPTYIRLMQAGKFNLKGLITHEFKLDQINDAIAIVKSGDAGRVLVAMED
jgi:S-(hydroxymethyl)glutathione dehydrogenase/alcohol dehydrogenase